MRILLTGASGFIGRNFLMRLRDNEFYQIKAAYHRVEPVIEASNIHYVQSDIKNLDKCRQLTEGIDVVCMMAGLPSTTAVLMRNPIGPVADNTSMHLNMFEAAYLSGVKKYLWLNSTTGYPDAKYPLKEEDFFSDMPIPPYESVGWMSRYLERIAYLYATKPVRPLNIVTLRPTSVFGEFDNFNFETCHALPALLRRVAERQSPIEIWGTGQDERDYIYVGDLINAFLLSLKMETKGYIAMNIGSGVTCSLNQLLEILLELANYTQVKIERRREKSSFISRRCFDCSLAERIIGFKAKTSIKEALISVLNWYTQNSLNVSIKS